MAKYNPTTSGDARYIDTERHSLLAIEHKDMRVQFLGATSQEEKWEGVFLPSFDFDLDSCDEAFQLSVGSCWKDIPEKGNPKHFEPNGWGSPMLCYTFIGEDNSHFMSPRNRASMHGREEVSKDDCADAFNDMAKLIRFDKSLSKEEKAYYLDKPDKRTDPRIPQCQSKFFVFANYSTKTDRNKPTTELIAYTPSAHAYNIEQMRWLRDAKDPVLSQRYPKYLLGDPTNPEAALVWTLDKRLLSQKDAQETNVTIWTAEKETLDSPLRQRVITPEMLSKRFVMDEPSNWAFPAYQVMVDYAVANLHAIPIELIKRACGHRADVGERKSDHRDTSKRSSDRRGQDGDDDDYNPMRDARRRDESADDHDRQPERKSFTPPPPPPSASVEEPATLAAKDNGVKYWAAPPGTTAVQMTVAELAAAAKLNPAVYVQLPDESWVLAVDSGLLPKPAAPTAPVAPTAPTAPTAPSSSTPAAVSKVPAGGLQFTPETVREQMVDDERYAQLTPAGRKNVDAITDEVYNHRLRGDRLPVGLMERVAEVSDDSYLG